MTARDPCERRPMSKRLPLARPAGAVRRRTAGGGPVHRGTLPAVGDRGLGHRCAGSAGPHQRLGPVRHSRPALAAAGTEVFLRCSGRNFREPSSVGAAVFPAGACGGKPITAHMLATGWVVVARHEVVHTLRREAAEWLEKPVEYPPFRAIMGRYLAAALYEAARDVAEKDPATAGLLMHAAVTAMGRHWFLQRGHFMPRNKELIRRAAELDA